MFRNRQVTLATILRKYPGPLACLLLLLSPTFLAAEAASAKPVLLAVASLEVDEALLLDVGVEVFNPGLEGLDKTKMEEEGIFEDVRKSEARYLPYQLKSVLESTGYWGAVRLVPQRTKAQGLRVSGTIIESNGFRLEVEIEAVDASGRKWFERRYKERADAKAYEVASEEASGSVEAVEPFADLYHQIANDLQKRWSKLSAEDVSSIRAITEMQFAAGMAPSVFGDYLGTARGRVVMTSLPAEGDPMIERVAILRERDYMFVDTLNEYYGSFADEMELPYQEWRSFSYEEQVALSQVRRRARTSTILGILGVIAGAASDNRAASDIGVIAGSIAIQRGMELRQESKIHVEALRELASSFDAEITPVLVEVVGETVRLEGAAEAQFGQWRQLLATIFATEMGLPVDLNDEAGLTLRTELEYETSDGDSHDPRND